MKRNSPIPQISIMGFLLCLLMVVGISNPLFGQKTPVVTDPATEDPGYDTQKQQKVLGWSSVLPEAKDKVSTDYNDSEKSIEPPSCFIPLDGSFTAIPRNDDGSFGPILLPFTFSLYGTNYNEVWINTNGNLTFTGPVWTYDPYGFPYDVPMVAPFWGDVDTRNLSSGVIYYKVNPTNMIVTWDAVGYFNEKVDKRNTFQVVIGTNEDDLTGLGQNVCFHYGDMDWTTGDASDGINGFLGIPATVGINHGNGVDYVQVGRFNQNNSAYDGPGGAHDGVHYLDYQCLCFNVSGAGNIPPSANNFPPGNSINVACGETKNLNLTFIAPEVNQSVTTVVNTGGLCNVTANVTNGICSNIDFSITGTTCNEGTHTITFTATDNGSPAKTTVVHLTVNVANCNSTPFAQCRNPILVADDECKAEVTVGDIDFGSFDPDGDPLTYALSPEGPLPVGINQVLLTVSDPHGAHATCVSFVQVKDETDPVITCPSNITKYVDSGVCGAVVHYDLPTVTDNCGAGNLPTNLPGFTYQGIFEGNAYFLSTSATTPEDANAQANAVGGHLVTIGSAAEDAFVSSMDPGRIWIGFTDNMSEGYWQWVTGEPVTYTNWAYGEPNNAGVGEDWAVTNWYGKWNDLYSYETALFVVEFEGGAITPTLLSGLGSGANFPVGTSTETWKATDEAGNSDQCSFTVTIIDNEPPTPICKPATVLLDADGQGSLYAINVVQSVSENCGIDNLAVEPSTFDCGDLGENTVVLTVTDIYENSSTCTATVTVKDNIDPKITCPDPITQGTDPGLCGASVDFEVVTSDNCNETTVVFTIGGEGEGGGETSGECATNNVDLSITFDNYPEETSWMILDKATEVIVESGGPYSSQPDGSTLDLSFDLPDAEYVFMIKDAIGDGICCSYGLGSYTLSSEGDVIATGGDFGYNDKVLFCVEAPASGGGGPLVEVQSGDFFPVGTTTVTCTVTDGSENTDVCTFDITVNDTEAPTIETPCPEPITLCGAQNVNWTPPTAADNCAVVTTENNYNPGDFFEVGTYTVTYTFYDAAGLSVSCSFIITINPLPEVEITQEDLPLWCQGIQVLTANVLNPDELTYPLTFEWSDGLGGNPVVVVPANGEYSVIVTDALGCSTEVSILVDEDISTLFSAYTIISGEEFEMYESDVIGGGVGIEDADEAEIAQYSNIFTFLRANADDVQVDGTSFINEFIDDDFEIDFPPFMFNPFVDNNHVTVPVNGTITLSGSNYGYVYVNTGGTLIIDAPQIYLQNLVTAKGATILLTQPTEIMIRRRMRIGETNVINPDGYTSVIYVSDNASVGQGSEVTINIYAPEGFDVNDSGASLTTYMTGIFISGDRIFSDHLVVWNWNLNCSFLQVEEEPVFNLAQPTSEGSAEIAADKAEVQLNVYPNPTSGEVNVEVADFMGQKVEYTVYDAFGKEVMHNTIDKLELPVITIDMSPAQFANGMYQLSVSGNKTMKTVRFVLTK